MSSIPVLEQPDAVIQGDRSPGLAALLQKRRRVRVPYVVLGSVLVVACALGFAVTTARIGGRVSVLEVVRAVPAGQQITNADITTVQVAGSGFEAISAAKEKQVVGEIAAVPLLSGELLTQRQLGPSGTFPPVGKVLVGVALKQGSYPAGLVAGDRAEVVLGQSSGSGQVLSADAVVESVSAPDGQGAITAVLLTNQGSATQVGEANGQVSVLVVAPGSTH